MTEYQKFLASKSRTIHFDGIPDADLNPAMFPFQTDVVRWALRKGRAGIFADCGMGKTLMQLEWARVVASHTGRMVLILAPLSVADQTRREGQKFGIEVNVCRSSDDLVAGINITNYERLHLFDLTLFGGIVLDESSILKSYDGKTRNQIIDGSQSIPFRLACTATPAPNDHMELGNHAEFVGVMTRTEMLATYFVHDGEKTSEWRLKGHAKQPFWEWMASWSCMLRKPSDMGYDDDGFELPPLDIVQHTIDAESASEGQLFKMQARTLTERRTARKSTLSERCAYAAEMVNGSDEPWIVWCNLNDESKTLTSMIPDAVEVTGSMDADEKSLRLDAFTSGGHRVIVTKPSIAGFGLNWQHCRNQVFVGLSDSYEQFYQATRRSWRFGQTLPVFVHIVTADTEGAVVANIQRKEDQAREMSEAMASEMSQHMIHNIRGTSRDTMTYQTGMDLGDDWTMYLGDVVERISEVESESVGFSVFSPPFASLYTYSNSNRDMGNCKSHEEFREQFKFLIAELERVMIPGRLVSVHCMLLPTSKQRDGFIGLADFRGEIIRAFQDAGFIYHSEVCIWKDPVTAMQRTKALGLLYKQLRKDATMSRQGIPDYLCTFRKAGVNPEPVEHTPDDLSLPMWQKYASPVWDDIRQSRTLQKYSDRNNDDERHICPLQLDVIERALHLWSNSGDLVLSPFAGIGSEGYCSIKMGRRFAGFELKPEYYDQAVANLRAATIERGQKTLFG